MTREGSVDSAVLNMADLPAGARVAIYGAGESGRKVHEALVAERPDCRVQFFLDSADSGAFLGKPLVRADEACRIGMDRLVDVILIASVHAKAMAAVLDAAGVANYRVVDPYYYNYDERCWELDLYAGDYDAASLSGARFYNVGALSFRHPYWTNVDYVQAHYDALVSSANPNFINHDLMSGEPFPIESGTAEIFYSAHTLEHIHRNHLGFILSDVHRCLRQGGVFRLSLPDVDVQYRAFVRGDRRFFSLDPGARLGKSFLASFASQAVPRMELGDDELRAFFEARGYENALDHFVGLCTETGQRGDPSGHVNWFNAAKVMALLAEAGFSDVRPCAFGQSVVPVLRNTRLFDNSLPRQSLYVEAVK